MALSTIAERTELAKLCTSRDWSKAIRVLDSILSQTCLIQDICNRAFCYSQLELHKHVIKDCDKALQIDPSLLQAYILKGGAYSALGRKEEAILVWEQGYGYAIHQSADLKQLLELEELLETAKQDRMITCENRTVESFRPPIPSSDLASPGLSKSSETYKNCYKSIDKSDLCSQTNGPSEIWNKTNDKGDVLHKLNDKDGEHENCNSQSNGTCISKDKLSDSELSDVSEWESAFVRRKANCSSKSLTKSSYLSDANGALNFETATSKKVYPHKISKSKSISVDFRLSRGIAKVNEGKHSYAISIFDQILKENPTYPEALIGRGTAHAFQRELGAAISDFTEAIQSDPLACEAWKRRGQARAALGESIEAIADLTKALEFEPNTADILHERGIVNFKFKDFDAAIKDLSMCVKFDKNNKSAYTFLGLALSSIGEYGKAEEAHLTAIRIDHHYLEAWAHLTQFYQDQANPKKAFDCLEQISQIDQRFAKAYHLRGLLLHGLGEHRNAIKYLSIGLSIEKSNIELLYLRASCYHAVGEYADAVKDYDATLDLELDSMDKFVLQCLAFYQKEIALYTASRIYGDMCWFNIDGDIDPLFKEYWCKRSHPKDVCEKVFRQPPLRDSLRKGKHRKQDLSVTKQKTALLHYADSIGRKIQYTCPGFLPNRRQHRMAGLAAIEVAQKVSKAWRLMQAEWKNSNKPTSKHGKKPRKKEKLIIPSQNRGGSGCTTSSSSETLTSYAITEIRSSGRSVMSWHDVYSIAVKWRQISEPCDPVVWVNKLSEEFNTGFGSHTPMILGQSKVVRYFPNFQRTLDVARNIMKDKKHVYNKEDKIIDLSEDGKIYDIMHAQCCSDLYEIIGEDFWLATCCNSTAFEGKQLEGTRITLVKMKEHGFDFAIRTPCTSSRWDEFEVEMTMAWEAVCGACCGETYGSTDTSVLENVRDAILRMTYYWYNFMPLSRGSAATGFIVLLGLLLAANMEFTGNIPQGLQVDWEAILNPDPYLFVSSTKSWLDPSLKVATSWRDFPDVASTFTTVGSVIAALSSYDDRAVNYTD